MKRKIFKQHDVPDTSDFTHEMCVCDSYPAWRALALLLGYSIYTHEEESTDEVVYRDCKDPFGRIAGTYVMFADPQTKSGGHILIPAHLTRAFNHDGKALSLANDMERYRDCLSSANNC